MEPRIVLFPLDAHSPCSVHLPTFYSESYMYGKAEALIEGERKTSLYDYALELNAKAKERARQYQVDMIFHIVSLNTFISLGRMISYGDLFNRFPYSLVIPVLDYSIAYDVYPGDDTSAILFPSLSHSRAA